MLPADLGLPPKFRDWRPGQLDAIIAAASSEKRFFLLSMPTGGGKSLTTVSTATMLGYRALILTGTKGLQQQYMADGHRMKDVRGQNNYRCNLITNEYVTVDDGPCHAGIECELRGGGCSYYDAIAVAAKSPLVVTNYMFWMTMNRYADPDALGRFDMLILDEAHSAPDQLADFCAVSIDKSELHALLELDLPPIDEGQEAWADWAMKARSVCVIRYQAARARVKEGPKYVKLVRRLTDIGRKLAVLAKSALWKRGEPAATNTYVPGQQTDWVAEYEYDNLTRKVKGIVFSPTWAHQYAEEVLFRGIRKVLLVSATLQPTTARYLGIQPEDYEFLETPSTFPPKRRPVMHLPTAKIDRNSTPGLVRVWVNKIDSIIEGRLDRKGVIHARSYDRAKQIYELSRNKNRLLIHHSKNAREVIDRFLRAGPGTVLVSPSIETGYDFPYELCEYQIIAKVPFLDTRSEVVKARCKSDKKYANYMAALAIIQMAGRGMRAEDDQCETFIVDDNIEWFWPAAKEFFPKWFKAAYKREPGVPDPPPRLKRLLETR